MSIDPERACRDARYAGLVVHRADPLNCETPLPALTGCSVVPNAHFYVRNHFQIPDLDEATWRLRVSGLVDRPLLLSFPQLRAMPLAATTVTLECAGNGRAQLDPPVPGEQWNLGAVSTAEWTGVPLVEVLERAGVRTGAREVVFRGADRGAVDGRRMPVCFERALSLDQVGETGALLAYAMNGEMLPRSHGFPLRLVVPGWYGVASVKWLTDIEVTDRPFGGYFQVDRYHIAGEPLTLQRVRSLIIEPRVGEPVEAGDIVIRGVAWSGAGPITAVEVSIDGGPWQPATLVGERRRHSWQWWELPIVRDTTGDIAVRARATDAVGQTQPDRPDPNPLGYANNAVHEVLVTVHAP